MARELSIPRVLVPRNPGILCALGLLLADLKTNFALTRQLPLKPECLGEMTETVAALEARAATWFDAEGTPSAARRTVATLDMRYASQNYELPVAWPGDRPAVERIAALRSGFEQAHRQMYGYTAPEEPIQAVTFRLEAIGGVRAAKLEAYPKATGPVETACVTHRDVWLPESGGFVELTVYGRDLLGPGHVIDGPAIVEQMDATTVILPGQTATVDAWLNILIEG